MYVLRAYLTVKTYVLRGVLERQTRRRRGARTAEHPASGEKGTACFRAQRLGESD